MDVSQVPTIANVGLDIDMPIVKESSGNRKTYNN